jgi:hypothetical protein
VICRISWPLGPAYVALTDRHDIFDKITHLYFTLHAPLVAFLYMAPAYLILTLGIPSFFDDETISKETKDVSKERRAIKDAIKREQLR